MRSFEPFGCNEAIEAIAIGLLSRTLPKPSWTHAAHFAATLWLLRYRTDMDLPRDMPAIIRSYNEATGGRNTDTEGYHETITQASIAAARKFLKPRADAPIFETCNALMVSEFGDPGWLLRYWSRERLFSAEARRSWMEPDLAPIRLFYA